jgi:sortase (surface protein transpeptidase)
VTSPAQPGDLGWDGPPAPSGGGPSGTIPAWTQRRRSASPWWLPAIVLLVLAAVVFGFGLSGSQRSLPGPLHPGSDPSPAATVTPAARSVPVTLSVPAIGLNVSLSQLGLNPDGTVQVPTNYQEPGWYRFGPSPGQLGSAVILGHVDSYLGPAVFFRLGSLDIGDRVDVTLADGVIAQFVVREVAMYLKTQFPTRLVYGPHGYSGLQLVTCGGVFDSQTGHYLSNVVVYTSLVATSKPGSAA